MHVACVLQAASTSTKVNTVPRGERDCEVQPPGRALPPAAATTTPSILGKRKQAEENWGNQRALPIKFKFDALQEDHFDETRAPGWEVFFQSNAFKCIPTPLASAPRRPWQMAASSGR